MVPQDTSVDWPEYDPPYLFDEDGVAFPWFFQDIVILETYYGELPEKYSLLEVKIIETVPSLPVGEQYIVFVVRAVVPDDAPEDSGGWHLNDEQLRAFGGVAGAIRFQQAWAIEGDTAWKCHDGGHFDFTPGSSLADAMATGDNLPVTDLVAAIKAGLEN